MKTERWEDPVFIAAWKRKYPWMTRPLTRAGVIADLIILGAVIWLVNK